MTTVRTVKKLLLGKEIEHMLSSTGTNQSDAAAIIECSQSRIAGLIHGQNAIALGDLERLANKLGFTDSGYQETLLELRRDGHKRGRWSSGYHRAYSEDIRLLVDLEKHAEHIRWTESEIVPGLAQCESYVRALYSDAPDQDGITLDDRVRARVARQEIYGRAEPPIVHLVLSESCLRRVWGGPKVMREQLGHLATLSNRPNVMIQVMPFNARPGRRSPIGKQFTMLRVPSPGVAGPLELVYVEGEGDIRYMDDKKAVAAHDLAWTRLSTAALSFVESRKFIRKVANEFT